MISPSQNRKTNRETKANALANLFFAFTERKNPHAIKIVKTNIRKSKKIIFIVVTTPLKR